MKQARTTANHLPFVLALAAIFAASFTSCATAPRQDAVGAGIHGLISRVEYGGNVAYIFGSAHMGRAHWFPLHPVAQDAIARADVFAFEVDMALMTAPEVVLYTQRLMMLPAGMTLQDILPPDTFARLLEYLETFPNVTYEILAPFTPVGALMIITLFELVPLMNVYSGYSVDSYIHAAALARGRPVIGLNDIFREIELLYAVPMYIQQTVFDDFGDFPSMAQAVIDMALMEAYEAQDAAMLRSAMSSAMPIYGEEASLYARHLHEVTWQIRSRLFADEIARLLWETQEPTTFFVTIGIGHLIGGDFGNVFSFLGDMGFSVAPLWE